MRSPHTVKPDSQRLYRSIEKFRTTSSFVLGSAYRFNDSNKDLERVPIASALFDDTEEYQDLLSLSLNLLFLCGSHCREMKRGRHQCWISPAWNAWVSTTALELRASCVFWPNNFIVAKAACSSFATEMMCATRTRE